MAKIVLATFGSLGDLYPFLGLGLELARRGCTVTIATHECYRADIPAPLRFHAVRPNLPGDAGFHNRFMDPRDGARFAHKEFLSPAIENSYADLLAAVDGTDLLVSQSLMLAAPLVAAMTGINWLSASFQPFTLYSAYDPPRLPGLPLISNPRGNWQVRLNRMLLDYAGRFTLNWVAPVLRLRERLGIANQGHPLFAGQHSPLGTLAMFPPLFGMPQPDWPPATRQVGSVGYTSNAKPLPAAVVEFLAIGAPPLLFTLGGSSSRARSTFYRTAIKVAQHLNRRALLIGDSDSTVLPPGIIMRCGPLPYGAIFPHGAAVIQPGGIGTAMLALQARQPQLLVPFAHDQTDNARRLERAGVAKVLPIGRFTARRATIALQTLLDDPELPHRLAAITGGLRDGAPAAADVIEQALAA